MLHHRFTEVQNNIRKLAFPSNLSTQTSAVPVWIEAVYGRRAFIRMLLHHVFYSRPEWTKQTKIRANPCYHHSRPPNPTCWTLWTGKLVSLIHFVVLHFCVVMDCGLILARKLLWHIYHIYPQNNNNKNLWGLLSFIWIQNATWRLYVSLLPITMIYFLYNEGKMRACTVSGHNLNSLFKGCGGCDGASQWRETSNMTWIYKMRAVSFQGYLYHK